MARDKGAAPTAIIRDTAGGLGRVYGARNTPQYAIIDPQGVLRYAGAIYDRPSPSAKDVAEPRTTSAPRSTRTWWAGPSRSPRPSPMVAK